MFMEGEELEDGMPGSALQKLWARRPTLSSCLLEESEITQLEDLFVSASEHQTEPDKGYSLTGCQPPQAVFHSPSDPISQACLVDLPSTKSAIVQDTALLGSAPVLASYEYHVVGMWVDPGIIPGYKYRVRPIQDQECRHAAQRLFDGRALCLVSVGRGYAKRITFQADHCSLNDNANFFWSDSWPRGFAFEIEVVSVGDKFTLHDANNVASGAMEVVRVSCAQQEVRQELLPDGSVEKTVRVELLAKVEWFEDGQGTVVLPVTGLVVSVKTHDKPSLAKVSRVLEVEVGSHHRRGFRLIPGVNDKCRRSVVQGHDTGEVPTRYTIVGLDTHELPVIGTYVDPRITPGFTYRVRPAGHHRRLFSGRSLRLTGVGPGYGKRITFEPDASALNRSSNFMWSDSHSEGMGFEPRAVHAGMVFAVTAEGQRLGEASVFRADAPQQEEKQLIVDDSTGVIITKYIHVDVTCHVTMSSTNEKRASEAQLMRVSGCAVVARQGRETIARLLRIENIGLDSQLNLLFVAQHTDLVFVPLCRAATC